MSNPSNPLVANLKLPGRIFPLPSRALFYRTQELAETVTNGELHVRPMSAIDEIHMKNPDQMYSGDSVKTVLPKCLDGVNKPTELLAKDVDAIMVYLRAVTYGTQYDFTAKHTCDNASFHPYQRDLEEIIQNMKLIDPTTYAEAYSLELPAPLGNKLKLRPTRYVDAIELVKLNQNKTSLTVQDEAENLLLLILGLIESVDGTTERAHIREWLSTIPAPMITKITDKISEIEDWGPDMNTTIKCKDCHEEFTVEIPLNPISFFTD